MSYELAARQRINALARNLSDANERIVALEVALAAKAKDNAAVQRVIIAARNYIRTMKGTHEEGAAEVKLMEALNTLDQAKEEEPHG